MFSSEFIYMRKEETFMPVKNKSFLAIFILFIYDHMSVSVIHFNKLFYGIPMRQLKIISIYKSEKLRSV